MAGITHAGIGLIYKKVTPDVKVGYLILLSYGLDVLFMIFLAFGLEHLPSGDSGKELSPWSHGLFMAVVWSLGFTTVIYIFTKKSKQSIWLGFLMFSHWIVDFIAAPKTSIFPDDTGVPLFFYNSKVVGLGVESFLIGMILLE